MLVLTRKPGERIVIGSTLTLQLLRVETPQQVRLAFESPHELRIEASGGLPDVNTPPGGPDEPARAELVLTVSEKVTVNSEISVMLVAIKGEQARLGLSAPQSVEIFREEVYQQIQKGSAREEREGSG